MKFIIAVLSAAFLLSSCANKSDPGLKNNSVNNTVVDSLKGKSPVEVLKLKYSMASAICELKKTEAAPGGATAASLDVPPVVEESEIFMNLKKWSEKDPELKPANAKVIKRDDDAVLTVDVTLKAEMVNLNIKRGNLVYLMKYSPQITYEFSGKFEGANGAAISGTGFINEKMNTVVKVGSLTVGEGAAAKNFEYALDCSLETKILKESQNAEEYQAQFEVLDCSAPKASQKKLAAEMCKKE